MEILFKAKNLYNHHWEYGGYHKHIKRTPCPIGDEVKDDDIIHLIIQSGFSDWNLPKPINAILVNPETICQFTTFYDRDENLVFEHDILRRDCYWDMVVEHFRVMPFDKVRYANSKGIPITQFDFHNWKIIGNELDCEDENV